ncbi:hypothetical protein FRC11_004998 [Ceratobasidium sp. 423]|nr:hypothetical protein FRC11_004998 [Ceratobasidium sp. 423]
MKQELGTAQPTSPEHSSTTHETSIYDKDAAAAFLADISTQDQESDIDLEAERRLLWKIDLLLMPLLTISYGLQYVSIQKVVRD